MGLGRDRVDDVAVVHECNGEPGRATQRAVVGAAAATEPVACAVDGKGGDEDQVAERGLE